LIKSSRQALAGALTFLLLSSGCAARLGASPMEKDMPAVRAVATATPAGMPGIPLIPITGDNAASVQCQFCVNEETHAVLIVPDFAYFNVKSSSPVTCLTANVVNGRRILLCRGPQSASFNLNVCSDSSNCLQFPVALLPCELLQSGPAAPISLTPESQQSNQDNKPAPPDHTTAPPATSQPVPANPTSVPPPTGSGGEEGGEVVICHIPPGNPDNRRTMTVSQSAWDDEHNRHGDSLGACP